MSIKNWRIKNGMVCYSSNENKIVIDGKEINVQGNRISIIDGKVFVDGKEIEVNTDTNTEATKDEINITVIGNVEKIITNGSIVVEGDVTGQIECEGSLLIEGDVIGQIECKGSLLIKGDVQGNVKSEI